MKFIVRLFGKMVAYSFVILVSWLTGIYWTMAACARDKEVLDRFNEVVADWK